MADTRIALLPDRGVVSVTGEDAGKLLQGVVTNDMGLLEAQPAIHAGLLTPQGKILFDFFVVRTPDGFLLETARDKAAGLADRLMLYRLRAKADIRDVSSRLFGRCDLGRTIRAARHRQGTAPVRRSAAAGARVRASS